MMSDSSPSLDTSYFSKTTLAPMGYIALAYIGILTLGLILWERKKRRTLLLLNQGYYFVEQRINARRKDLIPVAPDNVDTSTPGYPRIINPALLESNNCCY